MPSYFQPMNAYAATMYPNQIQYSQPFQSVQSVQPIPNQSPTTNGSQGIQWVQGEAGAKSFLVAPGQSVFLMDSESNVFYIKSSDPSGMPLPLRVFDYTERTSGQVSQNQEIHQKFDPNLFVTHEEFEKFKSEFFNRKKPQNQETRKEN